MQNDIYTFLSDHQISYERVDHPAVFTCEEAQKYVPPLPGSDTKNLFLRDKKGKRHFLLVTTQSKQINLKDLGRLLELGNLSFASPERLKRYLSIEPGSVSILALLNDTDHSVEVYIDSELWSAPYLQCHPLVNTATLVISREGIENFLKATGHAFALVDIP